jgi:hypothetical protein
MVVAQDIAQRFVGLITHRQLLHDWTLAFVASCLVGLSSLDLRYTPHNGPPVQSCF